MKPKVKLVGEDGNMFNIIGRVSRALKDAGEKDKSKEFCKKAMSSSSYDEVLRLALTYADIE